MAAAVWLVDRDLAALVARLHRADHRGRHPARRPARRAIPGPAWRHGARGLSAGRRRPGVDGASAVARAQRAMAAVHGSASAARRQREGLARRPSGVRRSMGRDAPHGADRGPRCRGRARCWPTRSGSPPAPSARSSKLLAVLVVAAYLVIDARDVGSALAARCCRPASARPRSAWLPSVLNRIGGYVRGQLVSSFFVGALIAIALTLLGVRYSLLIGAHGGRVQYRALPGRDGGRGAGGAGRAQRVGDPGRADRWPSWWWRRRSRASCSPRTSWDAPPGCIRWPCCWRCWPAPIWPASSARWWRCRFSPALWEIVRTLWVDPRRDA